MRISIKMYVSRSHASDTVSLDELGLSVGDWEHMTQHEKDTAIQTYCDELNDQPYWVLESYQEY